MERTTQLPRPATVGLAAALAVLPAALGGCYQKVTRAEGFGAERIPVEESDRPDGPIDQLLFGPQKQPTGGERTKR
jgi:hypothetical protein